MPKPWMVCSMRCVPKLQTQSPTPETDTQTLLIGQRTDMRARTHIRTAARWGGIVQKFKGEKDSIYNALLRKSKMVHRKLNSIPGVSCQVSCTLHPAPCTLHPASYALHPAPYTLHSNQQTPK